MTFSTRLIAFCVASACAIPAFAHEQLINPPPRANMEANQKVMPCGGLPRSPTPTQFQPGDMVTLKWTDTIYHPGWFRISFRATEQGDFTKDVLMDKIPVKSRLITSFSQQVQLPTTPCSDCTLQLIYVMTDQPDATVASGYKEYTACADILVGSAPATTTGAATAGAPTASATTGGTTGGATTTGGTTAQPATGGGTTAGGATDTTSTGTTGQSNPRDNLGGCAESSPAPWLMVLAGVALVTRRRRVRA